MITNERGSWLLNKVCLPVPKGEPSCFKDLNLNSSHCLLKISSCFGTENLVLNQTIFLDWLFYFLLVAFLLMNELILLGDFTWLRKIKFGYQNNPSQDTKREYDTFESSLRKKLCPPCRMCTCWSCKSSGIDFD